MKPHYIGATVITKVAIPSDKRGEVIPPGTRLVVLEECGEMYFNLVWSEGKRAASQVHHSKLEAG